MEPDQPVGLTRRAFLGSVASAALIGLAPKTDRPIVGGFVDDGGARGHRLRGGATFPAVRRRMRIPLVIVGGGIAGLSAAWQLRRRGFGDFALLEMEREAGGNARWGRNEVSAYPWAAHYVPVPGRGGTLVRELFADLGVLRDGAWEERALAFSPQERVWVFGQWREGLETPLIVSPRDRQEFERFAGQVHRFRATRQFTIPLAEGARASPLDRVSMAAWLDGQGFRSPALRWYVDYACRDDYGALASATSAWAGIHYFAARESDEQGPLTWPEGNGWIVQRLMARLGRHVTTGAMVHRVEPVGSRVRVLAGDTEYLADAVIWAAPTFVAAHTVQGAPPVDWDYSPWLTANLTLDRLPRERGAPLAWDNVVRDSPALGYVVATHQSLRTHIDKTVWTYYWALAHGSPKQGRAALMRRTWQDWKELILADLEQAHPDIRQCVSRIDMLRMGHAMARPAPGFLFSPVRQRFASAAGRVFYANSDLSGLSLFEEAQFRGVTAANRALRLLG